MQIAARLAARKPSRLMLLFWSLAGVIVAAFVSLAAWTFITDLMARYPLVGTVMSVLLGVFLLVLALVALREMAAFGRLGGLIRCSTVRHRRLRRMI